MISKLLKLLTVSFIAWILLGCSSFRTRTPENDFPSNLLMLPQDLPRGWARQDVLFDEVPNAQSITVVYVRSTDPKESHIAVSHQLAYYQTMDETEQAYTAWEKEWFTTDELVPPDRWAFQPKDTKDQFRFGCLNQTINENLS